MIYAFFVPPVSIHSNVFDVWIFFCLLSMTNFFVEDQFIVSSNFTSICYVLVLFNSVLIQSPPVSVGLHVFRC